MGGNRETTDRYYVVGCHQDGETFIRSRLVAMNCRDKGGKIEDLFAATPQLDTLKSMLALSFREKVNVMVVDVKKAHLTGVVQPKYGNHYARPRRSAGPRRGAGNRRRGSTE